VCVCARTCAISGKENNHAGCAAMWKSKGIRSRKCGHYLPRVLSDPPNCGSISRLSSEHRERPRRDGGWTLSVCPAIDAGIAFGDFRLHGPPSAAASCASVYSRRDERRNPRASLHLPLAVIECRLPSLAAERQKRGRKYLVKAGRTPSLLHVK
jgi:hypothetical protein